MVLGTKLLAATDIFVVLPGCTAAAPAGAGTENSDGGAAAAAADVAAIPLEAGVLDALLVGSALPVPVTDHAVLLQVTSCIVCV